MSEATAGPRGSLLEGRDPSRDDAAERAVLALQQAGPIQLARVVQTLIACPSQWDAWTTSGEYLYLRYRFGRGTVDAYGGSDLDTWARVPDGRIAQFGEGWAVRSMDGEITLAEFCERAGLVLAPGAEVTEL